jgi:hypothetical protein
MGVRLRDIATRSAYPSIAAVPINPGIRGFVPGADVSRRSKQRSYSITSSARASSAGGRVRANAFAVFRLIRSSNLVA